MASYAIVTGASAGLGKEFARLFAKDGHNLVLVARRKEELDALARELESAHSVKSLVIALDLSDRGAPKRIYDEVKAAGVDVEFLVNNAGFGSNGSFAELDAGRELSMIDVNIASLVHLTRSFVADFVARGRGRILNIGSTAGFQPGPYMATYYATKAFVNSFSEALAFELKGTGVTVTLSCPGATATEFSAVAGNNNTALMKRAGLGEASTVAQEAYAAMKQGKRTIIHGFKNKAGVQALRVSPRASVLAIAAMLNRPAN